MRLDELFKTKLDQLNFEFKPEYWEEMEQKLQSNPATSNSGGSFSSFGSFGQIAIFVSVIGIAGLVTYLSVPSTNGCDEEGVKQQYYQKNFRSSHNYLIPQVKVEAKTSIVSYKVAKKAMNSLEINTDASTPANDGNVINISLRETLTKVNQEYQSLAITYTEEKPEQVIEPTLPNITTEVKKQSPKEIIPIEKPIKRVFKPKDGILYRLGIRK